jgi:hypothetical protein
VSEPKETLELLGGGMFTKDQAKAIEDILSDLPGNAADVPPDTVGCLRSMTAGILHTNYLLAAIILEMREARRTADAH